MKTAQIWIASLILALTGGSAAAQITTEEKNTDTITPRAQGTLHLYDKNSLQLCVINMSNNIFSFKNNANCRNKEAASWKVSNAKPGTRLWFYESTECFSHYSWYGWLVTGTPNEVITMPEPIALSHDGSFAGGQHSPKIETWGRGGYFPGPLNEKLSCVVIYGT